MAAPIKVVCRRILPISNVLRCSKLLFKHPDTGIKLVVREKGLTSKYTRPVLRDLWKRRREQGPEPEHHRHVYPNWNYEAEIYSFGKRLNENFSEATIKTAFVHSSYIETEIDKWKEPGTKPENLLTMEDNESLATNGEEILNTYVKSYLRYTFPALPEECISALHKYLTTNEMLAHIAQHLGVKDLILCGEFPPSPATMKKTFHAIVGAVAVDQGLDRAQIFVQDFVLPQLIDKDLADIWSESVHDPMTVLADMLARDNRDPPESRLLFEAGSGTILAAFQVGIYSNKQLLGRSFGETATIAEEMAARDSLRRVWGTTIYTSPLPLGDKGRGLDIQGQVNQSLQDYKLKRL